MYTNTHNAFVEIVRCILNSVLSWRNRNRNTPLLAHYGAARASGCSRLTGLSGVALKQGPQHALRNRDDRPNPIKGSLPYRVGYPACTRTLGQRHTDECIDLYA